MRFLIAAALLIAAPAFAQSDWPNKPVRMVVSFAAGGISDVLARALAIPLSKQLGQQVIVDNKPGAGTTIAADFIVRSAPDGYTIWLQDITTHAINAALYAKLPYDSVKDFTEIVPLAIQPNVLVVNAGAPYKTVGDLVAAAKAKPGSINWGHAGIGSGTHLTTEKFVAAANIDVTQVPFKGTPEVIQAMFSGSVDCYWVPISAGLPHIKGGKLRALAVSTSKRNTTLPDVPTTGEAGVQGADAPLWFGVWGPAGMPAELVNKISADVRKALADPTVKERLANGGNDPLEMSPQEFSRFVRSEIDDYQRVVKAAGLKPQ
jgi:tripartite-type tricarboxylate transporter receptor subunit TctC